MSIVVASTIAVGALLCACCSAGASLVTPGTREERGNWLIVWGDIPDQVEPVLCFAMNLEGCSAGVDAYEGQAMSVALCGRQNRVLGQVRVDMRTRQLRVDWFDGSSRTMDLGQGNVVRLLVDGEERVNAITQDRRLLQNREEVERLIQR